MISLPDEQEKTKSLWVKKNTSRALDLTFRPYSYTTPDAFRRLSSSTLRFNTEKRHGESERLRDKLKGHIKAKRLLINKEDPSACINVLLPVSGRSRSQERNSSTLTHQAY